MNIINTLAIWSIVPITAWACSDHSFPLLGILPAYACALILSNGYVLQREGLKK